MVNRRKRRQQNTIGILLIAVCTIVVITLFIFSFRAKTQTSVVDSDTHCGESVFAHHVLLFDRSDALNTVQKASLRTKLSGWLQEVKVNERVSIYLLSENENDRFQATFSACRLDDGSQANVFVENKRRIEERWREKFELPLEEVLSQLMTPGTSETSPVLETIQAVAIDAFHGNSFEEKRLTIVSDMLHNTKELSFYQGIPDATEFLERSYALRTSTDLSGVSIDIFVIGRTGFEKLQTTRLAYFWQRVLEQQQGTVKLIERIDG